MGNLYRRLNITLPESTVAMLEKVAEKGGRSTFINEAIQNHVNNLRKKDLRDQIRDGSIANAESDLELAGDWFNIEEGLWQD